jgi:hypothetical protein
LNQFDDCPCRALFSFLGCLRKTPWLFSMARCDQHFIALLCCGLSIGSQVMTIF